MEELLHLLCYIRCMDILFNGGSLGRWCNGNFDNLKNSDKAADQFWKDVSIEGRRVVQWPTPSWERIYWFGVYYHRIFRVQNSLDFPEPEVKILSKLLFYLFWPSFVIVIPWVASVFFFLVVLSRKMGEKCLNIPKLMYFRDKWEKMSQRPKID